MIELDNCILKEIDTSHIGGNTVRKIINAMINYTCSAYSKIRINLSNLRGIDFNKIDSWFEEYQSFAAISVEKVKSINSYSEYGGLSKENDTIFLKILSDNNFYITKLANLISEQLVKDSYNPVPNTVFLVHGHNLDVRDYCYKRLKNAGYNPIILDKEIEPGKIVLDKFMKFANMSSKTIIFMTEDDQIIKDDKNYMQARPNVFLELGYFLAIMERKDIIIIKQNNSMVPSDIGGVIYETYTGDKKALMARILRYLEK